MHTPTHARTPKTLVARLAISIDKRRCWDRGRLDYPEATTSRFVLRYEKLYCAICCSICVGFSVFREKPPERGLGPIVIQASEQDLPFFWVGKLANPRSPTAKQSCLEEQQRKAFLFKSSSRQGSAKSTDLRLNAKDEILVRNLFMWFYELPLPHSAFFRLHPTCKTKHKKAAKLMLVPKVFSTLTCGLVCSAKYHGRFQTVRELALPKKPTAAMIRRTEKIISAMRSNTMVFSDSSLLSILM